MQVVSGKCIITILGRNLPILLVELSIGGDPLLLKFLIFVQEDRQFFGLFGCRLFSDTNRFRRIDFINDPIVYHDDFIFVYFFRMCL